MVAALKLQPTAVPLPAMPAPVDPLQLLPDYARAEAERSLGMIRPALIRVQQGVSIRAAALWLSTTADGMPSAKTLQRWITAYIKGGVTELAPKYKGRVRKERGWEARALALYNQPQRPSFATVAHWLMEEGFKDVNSKAVTRYLKAAPSQLTTTGKKRLGQHFYGQNIRPHIVRDNTVLPVGFVYEGDGHCCDVYVKHPARGHFRPELTVWIDVRSHYVVGWWISESESAQTTLFSLSQALVSHDHVPAYVHTDPGSGFKARMISDETAGFLAKFSIQPMLALPGNARGKGLVEGWFRWFEERCGKRFASFCGHCRTDDELSRLSSKIDRGEIELPTLAQYIDAIRQYVERYNALPQDGLGKRAPVDVWAELERCALHTPAEAVVRPRVQRKVRRWGVELDSRKYRAAELQAYEARPVLVEYSVHSDDRVWVLDHKGRFICEAMLVEKAAWMPASRIEEAQQKRLDGQRKRRALKDATDDARSRLPVSAHAMLDAINDAEEPALPAPDTGLTLGHSVTPLPPRRIEKPAPAISAEATERVRELFAEAAMPIETPEQRFTRALTLERQGCATESDATWLAHYQTSAEYHSRKDLHEAFQGEEHANQDCAG